MARRSRDGGRDTESLPPPATSIPPQPFTRDTFLSNKKVSKESLGGSDIVIFDDPPCHGFATTFVIFDDPPCHGFATTFPQTPRLPRAAAHQIPQETNVPSRRWWLSWGKELPLRSLIWLVQATATSYTPSFSAPPPGRGGVFGISPSGFAPLTHLPHQREAFKWVQTLKSRTSEGGCQDGAGFVNFCGRGFLPRRGRGGRQMASRAEPTPWCRGHMSDRRGSSFERKATICGLAHSSLAVITQNLT